MPDLIVYGAAAAIVFSLGLVAYTLTTRKSAAEAALRDAQRRADEILANAEREVESAVKAHASSAEASSPPFIWRRETSRRRRPRSTNRTSSSSATTPAGSTWIARTREISFLR